MQTTRPLHDKLPYTKQPTEDRMAAEEEMARLFFDPDMIDWGSDSDSDNDGSTPLTYCLSSPDSTTSDTGTARRMGPVEWHRLSMGVQWAILKVMTNKHRFAQVISGILHLTRPQVQRFIASYMAQHRAWLTYQRQIAQLPWNDMYQHAQAKNVSMASLLDPRYPRPQLSTDRLSREEIAMGQSFLRARGLGRFHKDLDDWIGTGTGDFVGLAVEWEIVQDAMDAMGSVPPGLRGRMPLPLVQEDKAVPQTTSFVPGSFVRTFREAGKEPQPWPVSRIEPTQTNSGTRVSTSAVNATAGLDKRPTATQSAKVTNGVAPSSRSSTKAASSMARLNQPVNQKTQERERPGKTS
jgi:hypothetical protein